MPVFNVSSVFGKGASKPSSDAYNVLLDQITIEQNSLAIDGKLSPGDYDHLISKTRKAMLNPGLNNNQRSNFAVKLSQLEKEKSTTKLQENNDINLLDRQLKNHDRKLTMIYGNNPGELLAQKSAALQNKLQLLNSSINSLEQAGDDSSQQLLEYNATLDQLGKTQEALNIVKNYQPGSNKMETSVVAYIKTNSQGEISSVEFGAAGEKNGYQETNGVYGGMQIYGMPNKKENGKKIFIFGNQKFSASDSYLQNPDGTYKSKPLIADDQQTAYGTDYTITVGKPVKEFNVDTDQNSETFGNILTVKPQSVVQTDKWARGSKGFLYKKLGDGSYAKYVNTKPSDVGIADDGEILDVPSELESTFQTSQVYDSSATSSPKPFGPQFSGMSNPIAPPVAPTQEIATSTPSGSPKTPTPTERAPRTASGVAGAVINKAKGFFGGLFNR